MIKDECNCEECEGRGYNYILDENDDNYWDPYDHMPITEICKCCNGFGKLNNNILKRKDEI